MSLNVPINTNRDFKSLPTFGTSVTAVSLPPESEFDQQPPLSASLASQQQQLSADGWTRDEKEKWPAGSQSLPPADNLSTQFTQRMISSVQQDNDASDSSFRTIKFDPRNKRIGTSEVLNKHGLSVWSPLGVLICHSCSPSYLVEPGILRSHRKGHGDDPLTTSVISELQDRYGIHQANSLDSHQGVIEAVPCIPIRMTGFHCPFPECSYALASERNMKRHIKSHIGCSSTPVTGPVQSLFFTNRRFYPVWLPDTSTSSESATEELDPAVFVWERFEMVRNQASNVLLDDQAHLTPFLAKYPWTKFAKGIDPLDISQWISRISSTDLSGLMDLVAKWIKVIQGHMETTGRWTTILRWINTPKE